MKTKLVQEILFHAEGFTSHTRKEKREVVIIEYPTVIEPRSHEDWDNVKLRIPPVCASTPKIRPPTSGRLIIEIEYALVFCFEPSGIHFSKDLSIPLCIGTVPLLELSSAQSYSSITSPNSFNTTPNYQPPSYECSVFEPTITNNDDDLPPEYDDIKGDIISSDARTFKPYYPYYGGLSS